MTLKTNLRGYILTLLCVLSRTQAMALVMAVIFCDIDMTGTEFLVFSAILVFMWVFSVLCHSASIAHPEFKNTADVNTYYKFYVHRDVSSRSVAAVGFNLASLLMWTINMPISVNLLNGVVDAMRTILTNDYAFVGLFAMPSFVSWKGLWTQYALINGDASVNIPGSAPIMVIQVIFTVLCITLAGLYEYVTSQDTCYVNIMRQLQEG